MKPQRSFVDVSGLPTVAFGSRAPIWWGVVCLLAIEGTVFALLAVTYFYLRGGAGGEWPPPGVVQPSLGLTTTALVILLLSMVPMHRTSKAAEREDLRGIARWLAVTTVLGIAFLVMRFFEFRSLTYEWRSHAYGSVVWVMLILHTFNLVTDYIESIVLTVLMHKGPLEGKRFVDVAENCGYWNFVVVTWIPIYLVVYWAPRF